MAWDLSCPDWADRLRSGRSLLPNLPLNMAEAERGVQIFNRLRLPDVPGQPMLRDAGGEWFRDMVRALYGSWDASSRTRHIREIFCLVPKKNSKTTGSAGIMVTALLHNTRPRAELLLIAPTIEIASLAYSQALGMIEADPVLKAKCHIQDHKKQITYRTTGAFLKIKSFDPKVITGSKPVGILLDELHVIAAYPNADRVIGQLRGGLISQPEGFLISVTTQSERPPSGVFAAELAKARAVRDGRLHGIPLLPILYEFPEGIDWRNPANWWMVTPNNGKSISVERLIPDYEAAVAAGEAELRRWASQHLNVEIGLALQSDRWAGADYWEGCSLEGLTLEELIERSDVITIGIDGGGLDDLLAICVCGRDKNTRDWLLWTRAFAHPSVLERRKSEAARLHDFARDGDLILVERLGDDIAQIADIVEQVKESSKMDRVGLDPAGIGAIVDALDERGVNGDKIVGIPQGWKLTGAIKTLERKLADGTAWHAGQRIMAWAVGNAKVEPRGNAIIITKQAAGVAKIDPLMAAFNAAALMGLNPEVQGPSVYETRGIVMV